MTINFNTAVKELEQWTAPAEIEKSGFGQLKVEGQEVTVCAKAVGEIHKIGEQLHRLGDMNKTKGKQDWDGNKAVVRELDGQIKALGATLDEMKGASSNLKTRGDIKAAIQFTKQIAAKAKQIEGALKGIEGKLDKTTLEHIRAISINTLMEKNNEIRTQLKDMKVSKHVKPEAKSKIDFLRVYTGVSKLPGIEKLIKGFVGIFVNLDAKVQDRLNSQLNSLSASLENLNTVSGNITSSTEAEELLKRTGEAKERLADFTGIALTVVESTTDNELSPSNYNALTATGNMSDELSQFEIELTQKKELLTQQEALAPLQATFDRSHDFDISSAGTLLRKLDEIEGNLPTATGRVMSSSNKKILEHLDNQIETLSARAHERLDKFGIVMLKKGLAAEYKVTVAHLENEYKKIDNETLLLPNQMETDPGLAQKNILNLLEKTTQLEGLQKQISGDNRQLIKHQAHIGELRSNLKKYQIMADAVLEIEASYIQGKTESLTVVFQELHRLAADHRTPESKRLEEIKAQKSAAQRIITALKDDPVTTQSPNYPRYSAELSRAREARARAKTLISRFDEKIQLEGIRDNLSSLNRSWANILKPEAGSEKLSHGEIETKIDALQDQVQNIQGALTKVKPKKGSPNEALFGSLQASIEPLQAEIAKTYLENKLNIINSEIVKLNDEIGKNFDNAQSREIDAWQQSLARHESGLNALDQLLNSKENTEHISSQLTEISELKRDLADRKIILEANETLEAVEEHLKKMQASVIPIDDKVLAFNDIIVLILPTQLDSLEKVASANKEGSKNFKHYSTAVKKAHSLAKTAINARDACLMSPEAVKKSLAFGKRVVGGISKQLDAVLDHEILLSDEKETLIQGFRDEISNLVKYYDNLEGKFPLSTETKPLVDQGREQCQELLKKVNEAGAVVGEDAELIRGARESERHITENPWAPHHPTYGKLAAGVVEGLKTKLEQSTAKNDKKYIRGLIERAGPPEVETNTGSFD